MSIKAMKQALEALANSRDYVYLSPTGDCTWSEQDQLSELAEAITALRQAIEQAEQAQPEPRFVRNVEANRKLSALLKDLLDGEGVPDVSAHWIDSARAAIAKHGGAA